MFVGVSRPGPACERSVSSRDLGDQRLRPGPEQMARRKRSTCAQDRLQFSEALGLATTVTGLGRSLSTDCRSKGVPSDHCWIVFTVTSNSEVPAGEVSLRYELEPTGGPDAGPGLPGWVTPQETSISAPSDRTVDIARAAPGRTSPRLPGLRHHPGHERGSGPARSGDHAPTHVRTRGPCRRADDHICAMTLRIRHSARPPG